MKNILFVSPTGTFDNGAEISIFYLMTALVKRGNKVINVAPGYQGEDKTSYQNKFKASGIDTYILPAGKWWWEDAPGGLPEDAKVRAFYYRENIAQIRQLIQENSIDLVVTNTVNMFQGALAAACESIPHFWLIHEFPENEFAYYLDKIDFIAEYSKEIYSVTGLLNQKLNLLFGEKDIKQFIPYSEVDASPLKKGEKIRFVSVGRLTERKNQLELLKAYHQSGKTDVELLLIGAQDEDYKIKCMHYIKKHNLKNVKLTGHLDNPWEELTDKDIFVSSSAMETFGLVYIEALLKGLPVIISDNPGYASAYKIFQEGEMYPLGDIEALSEKMSLSLETFTEQKQKSINKISEVREKYSIEFVYKAFIEEAEKIHGSEKKSVRHIENILTLNAGSSSSLKSEIKGVVKRMLLKFKKH
ncbi:glycosyltransferase family 4 protein [Lactococcus muris]|uniref:Glycosyltransferase family 4 protein n=1 Tax=Lactococcus muris TaxID=2941330 RepID=A0ABV4D5Z4_9LACT